jgi:hypothetical protein
MKSWNLARLALRTLLVLPALLGVFFGLIAAFLGLTVAKRIYCVRGRGVSFLRSRRGFSLGLVAFIFHIFERMAMVLLNGS